MFLESAGRHGDSIALRRHSCGGIGLQDSFEEFHQVVPDYVRARDELQWMPSSTFRSPLRLELATH